MSGRAGIRCAVKVAGTDGSFMAQSAKNADVRVEFLQAPRLLRRDGQEASNG